MELAKHVKSSSTIKNSGTRSKSGFMMKGSARSSRLFDGGKSDVGTAVGDSPDQNRIDPVVCAKDSAAFDDININDNPNVSIE